MKHLTIPNTSLRPKFKDLPIGAVFSDNHRHFAPRYVKVSDTQYKEEFDGELIDDPYEGKYIEDKYLYWKA